jgi:hypothetical protein
VDDASGLDLPQRRLLGVVLARLTGCVDAALEDRDVSLGAVGRGRRHVGLVDRLQPQRIDEAIAIIVAEVEQLAVADRAVGFRQPGIALRVQTLGLAVVDDLVGLNGGAVVIDLNVADRRYQEVGVVVADLVGPDQHFGARGRLRHDARCVPSFWPQLISELQKGRDLLLRCAWGVLRRSGARTRQERQRR